MRRRAIMGLLALGVIGGYGSGIAHLCHARHWHEARRQQVMGEFARTCVDAARTPGQGQGGQYVTGSAPAAPNTPTVIFVPVVAPAR